MDAEDSPVTRDSLYEQYQIRPFTASFFSPETYLLHMVLEVGDRVQVLYPSGDLSEAGLRTAIESALKRAAPGFLEVVGIWTPPAVTTDPFGQQQATLQQYQTVRQALRENYEVRTVSLADGQVPADVDVLFVLAPRNMSEREQYAIDQFLMRGGSVFLAVSPYRLTQDPMSVRLRWSRLKATCPSCWNITASRSAGWCWTRRTSRSPCRCSVTSAA